MPAKPSYARIIFASVIAPTVASIFLLLPANETRAELSPFQLDRSLKVFSEKARKKSAYLRLGAFPSNNYLLEADVQSRVDDRLAVIWSPLPLGVIYSVQNNVDIESAVSWELGLTSIFGWSLNPRFDSFFRRHLTPRVAFEAQLEYGTITPLNEQPTLWSLGLSLNMRYRVNEIVDFVQFAQLVTEDALLKRLFPNDPSHPSQETYLHVTVPIGIGISSQIREASAVGFEYSYRGLGLPESVQAHLFSLSWRSSW